MSEQPTQTTKPMVDIDFVKVMTSSAFTAGTVALLMQREGGGQMNFPIEFPDKIPFLSRFNGNHYLPLVAGGAVFLGSIVADVTGVGLRITDISKGMIAALFHEIFLVFGAGIKELWYQILNMCILQCGMRCSKGLSVESQCPR